MGEAGERAWTGWGGRGAAARPRRERTRPQLPTSCAQIVSRESDPDACLLSSSLVPTRCPAPAGKRRASSTIPATGPLPLLPTSPGACLQAYFVR